MEEYLRGVLGFKGERGYSAYEIAVKNGFIGTEKDWLAQLGTSSNFLRESIIHISTTKQNSFNLPDNYTSNCFIDVYINGFKLNSDEYIINTSTKKIDLIELILDEGAIIEIVLIKMNTNNFPIVTAINSSSTDDTTPSTKAVYDYVQNEINKLREEI